MPESDAPTPIPIDEVLTWPSERRIGYFKDRFVWHPHLQSEWDKIITAIEFPGSAKLILLFGPAGSGKTRLNARLRAEVDRRILQTLINDPGRFPSVGIQLDAPVKGVFDWDYHYHIPALEAFKDILIGYKTGYKFEQIQLAPNGPIVIRRVKDKPDYRGSLIDAFKQRQPPLFSVDDAQYMAKVKSGSRYLHQIDSIKALADATGVLHILFGTYDLLPLVALSPEAIRRSIHCHLRRYKCDDSEEFEMYKDVLQTMALCLPVKNQPDLVKHADWFALQTCGCVGTTKDLLSLALTLGCKEDSKTIGPKEWEAFAREKWELDVMENLITQGEFQFKVKAREIEPLKEVDKGKGRKKSGKKPMPGIRNPGADPVGIE